MRLLSERDVEQLIEPNLAIAAAEEAFQLQASGEMSKPGRLDLIRQSPKFRVLALVGFLNDDTLSIKANLHSYQSDGSRAGAASFLTLWDPQVCAARAFMSTAGFNNHRTAAGFAAAARVLSPASAATVTIFGAGKIAGPALRYLKAVRPIEQIIIIGRNPLGPLRLAAEIQNWEGFHSVEIRTDVSAPDGTREADVIVTATTSETPVFPGGLVRPGTLVILAGANRPNAREADDTFISRALIYADDIEGCIEKAGDIRIPIEAGVITRSRLAGNVGAVIAGHLVGPTTGNEIVAFKSIGLPTQDIVLAEKLLAKAESIGLGVQYDMADGSVRCEKVSFTA